ncbi:MAG TPA: TIGR04222 domain-containing membrane protein, partial [Pyrinomonadaceae bacterium]|jgi:uncharacterized protein (TIGR04222 family)
MDILLDNPLATMYGPYFLIIYGFFIFFVLISLGYAKIRIDRTDELPIPPVPVEVDPYEIAFLRGGVNETARTAIFSLVRKNYAKIEIEGKNAVIKRINRQADGFGLTPNEQLALRWLGSSRETVEVFAANGLNAQLEEHARTFQARLEARQMLFGDEMKNRLAKLKWTAAAAIFFLGAYKIFAAVAHGNYNFVGIVVLAFIAFIIVFAVGKPPRVTRLGKTFLDRLQLAFENLKYQSQAPYIAGKKAQTSPQATVSGVDPLLLSVGVFGSGILAGTVFDNYNEAFRRAQQQSAASSCGSSCGSSCSSGDSGGSSCGSGCGGCGGGGD